LIRNAQQGLFGFCVTQTYLEMAQELVIDENILLQTLGMLLCTVCVHLCHHV